MSTADDEMVDPGNYETKDREMRIILTGSAGAGKSATGNSILGGKPFLSRASQNSMTLTCEAKTGNRNGRNLVVVDTPGFFNGNVPEEEVRRDLRECWKLCHPGPHAIVLVLQVGRFSQEEQQSVERIQSVFGRGALKHMVIVFTRKEDLEDRSIDQFVNEAEPHLMKLIAKCGNRYCAFNNKATGEENTQQVMELINTIDRMEVKNGGHFNPGEAYTGKHRWIKRAAIGGMVALIVGVIVAAVKHLPSEYMVVISDTVGGWCKKLYNQSIIND
ncbi:GTPase IMAP family member 3-like isoform X2 [Lissotriton helveticus]